MTSSGDELLQLEERRRDALAAGDGAATLARFSEDYVHCHATGLVHDKAQIIRHMLAAPRRVAPSTPRVRVYGDIGLLTGEMTNVNVETGEQVSLFVTQVARRFEDKIGNSSPSRPRARLKLRTDGIAIGSIEQNRQEAQNAHSRAPERLALGCEGLPPELPAEPQ